MSGGDFFDSDVFVYLFDDSDARKQLIAHGLVARALDKNNACVSFQVVQETLHVLTRKFANRVPPDIAKNLLQNFLLPLWRVQPSAALYSHALAVQERWRFSFYDSLIVAAALEADCKRLLTEDFQHGQRIDSLIIENPFLIDSVTSAE